MTFASPSFAQSLTTVVCAAVLASAHGNAVAVTNPDLPTALELARLPGYCKTQFTEGRLATPPACGVWMNHFCPGLVFLLRANDFSAPKSVRQAWVGRARQSINYTTDKMPATCAIAGDVQAADAQVRALEKLVK